VRPKGKAKQRRVGSLHRRIKKAQIRDAIRVRAKALARALVLAEEPEAARLMHPTPSS